ncbi:MAG: tetratricopeptide repeat protein [Phycisphaerae bacterium]|nr:tetratricopeptide repeat protein [Phycisphaerae bacterium]
MWRLNSAFLGQSARFAALLGLLVGGSAFGDSQALRSRQFDLEYVSNEDALPLTGVRIWYTVDDGATWSFLVADEDRQSPASVEAPREGRIGLYVVLSNAAGDSAPQPEAGTAPQQRILVDATPPVVQLHPLQEAESLGRRVIRIRWTAIDAFFPPRPIELHFRSQGTQDWSVLTPDPLANTGQYDWLVPDGFEGPLEIRVAATDLGGNRIVSEMKRMEVPRVRATDIAWLTRGSGVPDPITEKRPAEIPAAARERAARLFAEGLVDRDRGDYRQGVAKLRRAVELDPFNTEAFAELGNLLFQIGEEERALSAFDIALMQDPKSRSALQGSARVLGKQGNYQSAAQRLRAVLRNDPRDAEVWLNLGDVAIYQGDEVLARDCYDRAARINPQARETVEQARRRLALMDNAAGTPRQGESTGDSGPGIAATP